MSISLAKQRRGDFNHQAVLSAVEIDFADMLPTFRYHHLIQTAPTFTEGSRMRPVADRRRWQGKR